MNDVVRTLVTLVLFFGILGALVLVHEVGHFIVARLFRVRVLEFGVGFPPRAKVIRDVGETVYTLNWLPIGGFVKLEGDDGDEADDPRSFTAQPLWKKLVILLAGVVMNVVLAFAIFAGIAMTGDPAIGVYVPYVDPGSPAEVAGVKVGDVIERVDGRAHGAFGPGSVLEELHDSAGETVTLTIRRGDEAVELTATLRTPVEVEEGKGALGIGKAAVLDDQGNVVDPGIKLEGRVIGDKVSYPVEDALGIGVERTVTATSLIIDGVGQLVTAIVTRPTEPPPASGPVGIATQIGDVFWSLGPIVTLYLAGILSANLAIVNILPFPPLDGGRMLMLILKRGVGERLSLRAERLTYFVGFAMLLAFLVWVTAFDIARGLGGG
ncbi:MAG TPA: M50 family metallopeptidase [Candidatus Limnocylindrales bacterium]|nr:M50 family metallopeptidase [Candidatus Limnocylindrales bacterium]